jgi:nucleotide-binding universal stress UspA family protein
VSRVIGRVVVGVSGSPESLHALRHAVQLARQYDATLIAVNAASVRAGRGRPERREGHEGHLWQRAASLVLRDAFDEGLGGLPKDLGCVLLAAPGAPGPALVAVADRANDVLVLGAAWRGRGRGWRGFRGFPGFPGPRRWRRTAPPAVAGYCITHAVCSVLTVPPPPLAVSARASRRLPLPL